jgi:uncharacterized Zn-binding protein involved in type VI secretion
MPRIIRLGDPTSHGGAVSSVSATHFKVGGIPIARVGDACSCPKKGHSDCVIAEGNEQFKVGGIAVAFEGHKTSCGAVLQASVENFSKG